MDFGKEALRLHGEWKDKIEVVSRVPVNDSNDLSLVYTPGVESPCLEIQKNVDMFPQCVRSRDVDGTVHTIALISGSFGGVNLEGIAAPRGFENEGKLLKRCDIPVFHDDQHGTAVITLARV